MLHNGLKSSFSSFLFPKQYFSHGMSIEYSLSMIKGARHGLAKTRGGRLPVHVDKRDQLLDHEASTCRPTTSIKQNSTSIKQSS